MNMRLTLLWRGWKCTMHFSLHCDQLDDPMILPKPITLRNVDFLFHAIHLSNFRFFMSNSSFLASFRRYSITFTEFDFLITSIKSNGESWRNVTCRRKVHSWEWMHEGLSKNKTWVWKLYERGRHWNGSTTLRIDIRLHNGTVGTWCIYREIIWRSSLWLHRVKKISKNLLSRRSILRRNLKKARMSTWSWSFHKNRGSRRKCLVLQSDSFFCHLGFF